MPEKQRPDPDHYLVTASGLLGSPPQSSVADVDLIISKVAAAKPENGLVIHMHGGLVSRRYALDNIVGPLTDVYKSANAYPLFFVWESGFLEALGNNKNELLSDPAFRELVKKVSEWALRKISLSGDFTFKGAAGTPIKDTDEFRREFDRFFDGSRDTPPSQDSDVSATPHPEIVVRAGTLQEDKLKDEIEAELDNDPGFKQALAAVYNASIPVSEWVTRGAGIQLRSGHHLLDLEVLDEMFPGSDQLAGERIKTRGFLTWAGVARYVAKVVVAVIKRYADGRDHGIYCTVVEEVLRSAYGNLIGAVIWNKMKGDTLDAFGAGDDHCGYNLITKLKKLEDQGHGVARLTLVGHSTGAIYICNFLDEAARQGLKADIRVAFLAPAITCERFAAAIDKHGESRLKDFRMFAMTDVRESEDRMLTPLYTRSLLYFVSGLLEGRPSGGGWDSILDMPIVGMQRFYEGSTFGADACVQTVTKFLGQKPHRIVWSPAAGNAPGLNCDSRKHGDFDNDPTTLASLVAYISD